MGNECRGEDHSQVPGGTVDDAFVVLRDRQRRYALYFLLEHETASLDELADVVTGWTRASTYGMAGRSVRDGLYRELVHCHAPLMVETGVVSYDDETDTLSLDPCPPAVRSFVRLACLDETSS